MRLKIRVVEIDSPLFFCRKIFWRVENNFGSGEFERNFFEIGDHKFEWDSEKAEINLKKHKVAFEEAARIFLDDYRIDDYDELHSDDEERIKTIGFVRNVLAVIYTERGDRNRIISARRANKREETTYYAQFYD